MVNYVLKLQTALKKAEIQGYGALGYTTSYVDVSMRMTEGKLRRAEEGIEEGKEEVKKMFPFTKPTLRGSNDGSPPK